MSTQIKKKTPCRIKVRSLIRETDAEKNTPIYEDLSSDTFPDMNNDKAYTKETDEVIEFSTEGTVTENKGLFEITYKENESLGMSDIESTLRFKKSNPDLVNLIRSGSSLASFIFDARFPRQNCTYYIDNMPLNFCIITNEVVNTFDEKGGKIILDYEIEMQGIKTEHNKFTLEYTV